MVGILYISYDSTKTVLDIINIFQEIRAVVLYIYHNKRGYINKARKTMSYSKIAPEIFKKDNIIHYYFNRFNNSCYEL